VVPVNAAHKIEATTKTDGKVASASAARDLGGLARMKVNLGAKANVRAKAKPDLPVKPSTAGRTVLPKTVASKRQAGYARQQPTSGRAVQPKQAPAAAARGRGGSR